MYTEEKQTDEKQTEGAADGRLPIGIRRWSKDHLFFVSENTGKGLIFEDNYSIIMENIHFFKNLATFLIKSSNEQHIALPYTPTEGCKNSILISKNTTYARNSMRFQGKCCMKEK